MKAVTLTKHFSRLLALSLLSAAGIFTNTFAGPEPLPDSSKDKNPIVEIPICNPRWYFTIGGGADINVGGTLNNGLTRDLIPQVPGLVTVFVKHHDWSDVYDMGYRIQGELGFVSNDYLEFFGLFKYEHQDASDRTRGSFADVLFGRFDIPFSSKFDDYNSYGFEFGARLFFLSRQARFRPYVSVSGGPTRVENIDITTFADFSSVGGPSDVKVFHGRYFQDSLIGTAAGILGLEYALNCHVSIGVEGGVRYESPLRDDDRTFEHTRVLGFPLGFLRPINNDAGDRLMVPVTGFVKVRW